MIDHLLGGARSLPSLPAVIDRVGWMLIDSLWQFALVATFLGLTLQFMRRASSRTRYAASLFALSLIVLLPVARLVGMPGLTVRGRVTGPMETAADLLPSGASAALGNDESMVLFASGPVRRDDGLEARAPAMIVHPPRQAIQPWLLTIVAAWILGVGLCSLRPLFSWRTVARLRRKEASPLPDALRQVFVVAATKIGLRRKVEALSSGLIQVPAVVGYFRPVVLIPLALVTAWPTDQLEVLIVHELAHIRRHDYLFNVLQMALETLFFYHPGVWWISHQLRLEREECCDDIVLGVCRDRFGYARALIALEESRADSPALTVAAGGGSLLERIRRIVGANTESKQGPGAILWASALVVFAVTGFLLGSSKQAAGSGRNADTKVLNASRPEPGVDVFPAAQRFSASLRTERAPLQGRSPGADGAGPYHVAETVRVGGEGRFEYLAIDSERKRLYIPRWSHAQVLDVTSGKVLADIPGQRVSRCMLLDRETGRGFISNALPRGVVEIFDLGTNTVLGKVDVDRGANGIIYDRASRKVYVACQAARTLVSFPVDIDPNSGKADSSIRLAGSPEAPTSDGQGRIYVNLEDTDQVAVVDSKAGKIIDKWSIAPGGSPNGLAIDSEHHRLFVGCRRPQKLIVLNTEDGGVVADLPIGATCDAVAFDNGHIFASCGDGTLNIAKETSAGKFEIIQNLKTRLTAKTMVLDRATHAIYLPAVDLEETQDSQGRQRVKPDSFMVVVVRPIRK